MTAAHTPGPWVWTDRVLQGDAKYAGYGDTGGFVTADGTPVCWFGDSETYYPTEGTPPTAADARLIAAAPDLLEALIEIVAIADRKTDAFDRARAAIAKAHGVDQ
jgi:hypothetical protein